MVRRAATPRVSNHEATGCAGWPGRGNESLFVSPPPLGIDGNRQQRALRDRGGKRCLLARLEPRGRLDAPSPFDPAPGYTSRLSIAKRTSSEAERKPSFCRMMEEVLAIVL